MLKGCISVIACSNNDYRLFTKIHKNVTQIDNGVDIKRFQSIKKKQIPGRFIYFGRVDYHKRIDLIIHCVKLLKDQNLKVQLNIIGPNWNKCADYLADLVHQLGIKKNVYFYGEVSNRVLLEELSLAHIFMSASEYEGFGISAVEAMSSRTICLLNKIPSFMNIITHNKNGILTSCTNLNETAQLIKNILHLEKDQVQKIQDNAYISAKKYSWEKIAKKICDEYKKKNM